MKIYLIRHAQAEHNVSSNTGILDPQLTLLGQQQCVNKKELYSDVTMVLSSTATRTLQTSSLLFDRHIPFYATDLALEYQTGASCNNRKSISNQKQVFQYVNFETYLVPELNKETTWQHGEERAKKLIEMIKTIKTPVLAVVSHANFIRNIMSLSSKPNSDELENCGSYILEL